MKYMKLIIFAGLYLISWVVFAQPSITSVDKTQLSTGILSLSGSGFGAGPSIALFDRFETSNAVPGNTIPLTSPTIGAWTAANRAPIYNAESHSGQYSAQMFDSSGTHLFTHSFSKGIQEIYLSYWVRIPDGVPFPGASAPREFPFESAWKFTWLIDQDYQGNSSDICLPQYSGQGTFSMNGNDMKLNMALGNAWWSWDTWMRIGIWLRANPVNPTDPGKYLFQTISQEHGVSELWGNAPIFDADGPALKQFTHINFPGWMKGGSTPLYDDVYIATGVNAIAHVEITDSPDYDNSHAVAVQPSKSWSDNSITVDLNADGVPNINSAYLFVWDKDGNRNSVGFPIGAAIVPPMYPGNIQ